MKLFSILILHKEGDREVKILQNEFNLDSFGYFQRRHIQSFIVFSARTIIERTDVNVRQSIELKEEVDGIMHVYVRSDGLAAVVACDHDYPTRVAYSLLSKVMEDFTKTHPSDLWRNMAEGSGKMTSLSGTLTTYQNPQEADPLMRLQTDLDETKGILVKNIEMLLDRGERLDVLFAKSKDLSFETKRFYGRAKDMNRCCTLL